MPPAARIGDTTSHGGTIIGPGVPSVLIGGLPAAVMGDTHKCSLPPIIHPLTIGMFMNGSSTVMIGGRPALRMGDVSACGAAVLVGCPTVEIA